MRACVFFLAMVFLFPVAAITQTLIPAPAEFLPNKFGNQFTQHHHLVEYFREVGRRSDRVVVAEYGKTYQGRPLLLAFVSSEKNIDVLEKIRQNNLIHAGVVEGKPMRELDKAIVWLSFGVHGNEAGTSEAALSVLFELASGGNREATEWLENTIVIIDPCINPDGYNRYVQWYINASGSYANPRHDDRQHHEPWPSGRSNHYYFDLNRDWSWATQIETRTRLEAYNSWLPHVHVDYHEQYPENPYFFAPATEPFHAYITPWQRELQERIGKNNARYFDAQKWLYFTREQFDLLYPGYGDTYPTFNGAVGMTYEQAGHGLAGSAFLLDNGDTLTLADRILHHTTTALATVQTASENRKQITAAFARYFKKSREEPVGSWKAYFVKANQAHLRELLELLDLHGIEYGSAGQKNAGDYLAYDFRSMQERNVSLEAEDILISVHQPKSTLLQVLFEPEPALSDSLTYDITAWSIPYAYGLETYALRQRMDPVELPMLGMRDQFRIVREPYAYILEWTGVESAKKVALLMQNGIRMRYTTAPLAFDGRIFERGSVVITRADNPQKGYYDFMEGFAGRDPALFHVLYTGLSEEAPDLGSSQLKLIEPLRILLLGGEEVSSYGFGYVWHFLDNELRIPYTVVEADRLARIDLHDYNCIVVPDGRYTSVDKELKKELMTWMAKGGRIIAMGSALGVFEGEEGLGYKKYASEQSEKEAKERREELQQEHLLEPYEERLRSSIPDLLPGAIVRLQLDSTHPLAYGLGDYYFSLKTSSTAYEHLESAFNVGYLEGDVRYHGFIGKRALDKIKGSSSLFVIQRGRGAFVGLVDNPLYRGFWLEGKLLFSNALFFN